jgi:hypothetical protein
MCCCVCIRHIACGVCSFAAVRFACVKLVPWFVGEMGMCGGVLYAEQGVERRVYFPNPQAQLPVRCKGSAVQEVAWGRRKAQAGVLPQGGWARLDSVKAGVWQRYHPRPVKITVQGFMEKDVAGVSHWFAVPVGQYIQGLLAYDGAQARVYVVTVEATEGAVHRRWPRVLAASHGQ